MVLLLLAELELRLLGVTETVTIAEDALLLLLVLLSTAGTARRERKESELCNENQQWKCRREEEKGREANDPWPLARYLNE